MLNVVFKIDLLILISLKEFLGEKCIVVEFLEKKLEIFQDKGLDGWHITGFWILSFKLW